MLASDTPMTMIAMLLFLQSLTLHGYSMKTLADGYHQCRIQDLKQVMFTTGTKKPDLGF
jgi:hypothetical protein